MILLFTADESVDYKAKPIKLPLQVKLVVGAVAGGLYYNETSNVEYFF
jgi:hypothetical protein